LKEGVELQPKVIVITQRARDWINFNLMKFESWWYWGGIYLIAKDQYRFRLLHKKLDD